MGKHLKKFPLIIEFNGLPGSGKTTLSSHIADYLNKNNIRCLLYQDYLKLNSRKSKVLKVSNFLFELMKPSNWPFIYYSTSFLKSAGLWSRDRISRLRSMFYMYMNIKKLIKKESIDVIIIDQGVIQTIISILFLKNLSCEEQVNKILECLSETITKFCIINVHVDVDLVSQRIVKRQKMSSRIDRMNEEEARDYLLANSRNFNKIRKIISEINIQHLNIDTFLDVKKNSRIITDWIFKLLDY